MKQMTKTEEKRLLKGLGKKTKSTAMKPASEPRRKSYRDEFRII